MTVGFTAGPGGAQEAAWLAQRRGLDQGETVSRFLPAILAVMTALLPQGKAAPGTTPEITDFASFAQCGQVLSLTNDDDGRIFAAVTERSFGRGTIVLENYPVLAGEDQRLRSVAARERLVTGWLGAGKLASTLKHQVPYFSSAGDGAANYLTKYSEKVIWLTDVNQDGIAESPTVVADAFRDPMDGPGSTLLALPQGRWLYGCSPVLWRLEDVGNDQRAAERASVADGFGLRNNPPGGGLHALLEAHDGWIYWTMGDRGYDLREAAGRRVRGLGSGAVFRCRPDGGGVECVARGLRNPTALAMRPDGQLLAMDEAAPGGKTRLLSIIAGADFGWQAEAVTAPGKGIWFEEAMESALQGDHEDPNQPYWIMPALTTLNQPCAGMELLPDGTLLTADPSPKGGGGLHAWKMEDTGATLQLSNRRTLWEGGAVMALTQSPQGSIYFADWGDGINAASRCRIRRASWPAMPLPGPAPETVSTIIRKLPETSVRELKALLAHPSLRVALRARQRLEGMSFQESLEALLQVARRGPTLAARLHGLRGAGAVARRDTALLKELTAFLTDPEPVIRAVAATQIGEGKCAATPPALRRALLDSVPRVRLAAAAAIARLKSPGILPYLLEAAAANQSGDVMVRHSLAHALAEAVPAAALAAATASHASTEVRLTAVLALRRSGALETAVFLSDSEPAIAGEAARAIYDLPLRPCYRSLTALLERPGLAEPILHRALAAALYLGTPAEADLVSTFAISPTTPTSLKSAALRAFANWDHPPMEDPLWNRPEPALPRAPGHALNSARRAAESLKQALDPSLAAQAVQVLNSPAAAAPSSAGSLAVLNDSKAPAEARLAALSQLASTNALPVETAKTLTNPSDSTCPPPLRAEARAHLMRRDPKSAPALVSEALASATIIEKQAAIRTLDHLPGQGGENEKLILELVRKLGTGGIDPGIQVEVLEALQRRDVESRSVWRRAAEVWQASLPTHFDEMAPWYMAIGDGDANAGRVIFETHTEVACLSCHSVNGIGGLKGPDLDGVAGRLSKGGLLESLIHPGAKIAGGYGPALPSLDVTTPGSPMPPTGTILTLRELRDLMTFLSTLTEP